MICLCFTKIGQLTFPSDDEQVTMNLKPVLVAFLQGIVLCLGISPRTPNSGTPFPCKLPILFPYFKGFLWEFGKDGLPLRIRG